MTNDPNERSQDELRYQDLGFGRRICRALNGRPRDIAKQIGVPYEDLRPLLDTREGTLIEIDRDEVWAKLADRVDQMLGELMAVREAMQRKLAKDRQRRALLWDRIQNR